MKYQWPYLLWLFTLLVWACNPRVDITQINGSISLPIEAILIIDGEPVEVSIEGDFSYVRPVKRPQLLDISYGKLEWTLFLMPDSHMELLIKDQNQDSIKYGGDFKRSNAYLLTTLSIGKKTDQFFNQNWMVIHGLDQAAYVSTIDSLKNTYLRHLSKAKEDDKISADFIDVWTAEINYSFNALILQYPKRFLQFPPAPIDLNEASWEYLQNTEVNHPGYSNLPGYNSYTKTWISFMLRCNMTPTGRS